jgi:hypothetical protein
MICFLFLFIYLFGLHSGPETLTDGGIRYGLHRIKHQRVAPAESLSEECRLLGFYSVWLL